MIYDFAALRFAEDKNISERVYWYLCEFPVAEGDKVLAPVGSRNRLQMAIVERTLSAQEENAPYDMSLIKRAAAKYGARKIEIGDRPYAEFGGVRYDEKHYTRFEKVLFCRELPEKRSELSLYGVTKVLQFSADESKLYEEIARTNGCVLLTGEEGERAFRRLLEFSRGDAGTLKAVGVSPESMDLLREKLT